MNTRRCLVPADTYTFRHADFSKEFSDYDRYNHLPKLARFIYNLTDCQLSEKESRHIAVELAQTYLRQMRRSVEALEKVAK